MALRVRPHGQDQSTRHAIPTPKCFAVSLQDLPSTTESPMCKSLRSKADMSESLEKVSGPRDDWSLAKRAAFRFAFVYFVLYNLPAFPLILKPGEYPQLDWYTALWRALVPWVGAHIFGLPSLAPSNDGSETAFTFIRELCIIGVAVVLAAIWSLLDRHRKEYDTLHDWLRIYVRYVLAFVMMMYGSQKVIKTQFPSPSIETLAAPLGLLRPNELLWNFMGHSVVYNLFTGLGEVVGGLLLFFRRTTTLGALILVGVMSNVVLLNFAYDVIVKVYSTFLLLMALFLLLPDLRRLIDFFIRNRTSRLKTVPPPLSTGRWRYLRWSVKAAILVGVFYPPFVVSWRLNHTVGDNGPVSPLAGVYDVETFVRNGDTLQLKLGDTVRWRRVVIGRQKRMSFVSINDTVRRFVLQTDTTAHRMTLTTRGDTTTKGIFAYEVADGSSLVFRGRFRGDSIQAQLKRIDTQYPLLQPFKLVKEGPRASR
jgi:uncharacterized membrane protein YphA (DoxX/SURF4 family)